MGEIRAKKDRKEWSKRAKTTEEIAKKIKELEEQILAWELEVRYEDKQNAFREVYLAWYEERITLDEVLQAIFDRNICKRISVWPRE